MRTIYTENKRKIMQNKGLLERTLCISMGLKGDSIIISGDELNEYLALMVFDAIELGFSVNEALLLTKEDYVFEKINIKDVSRRKDLSQVRARVIGTFGKTLKTMRGLSNCEIVLHDNIAGVIGKAEDIELALNALKSLIKGSKQSNVYSYLEKSRKIARGLGELEIAEKTAKNKF